MNTKHTLIENINVTPSIQEMIDSVDFRQLETFVITRFVTFVSNRGIETVRYDLNYDVQTPTDDFVSDLLETGSVQLLKENGLFHHKEYIDALYVIISAISLVVAGFLQQQGIANVCSYRYIDADPQYVLLERAVELANLSGRNDYYFSAAQVA